MTDLRVEDEVEDEDVYEGRAEFLTREDFDAWTHVDDFERSVLRKLASAGPKLLVGPRGCGKSTLLLLAAERIEASGKDIALLVNYGRSMMLEPAFRRRGDAGGFFQDWLVARILESLGVAYSGQDADIDRYAAVSKSFIRAAESDVNTDRPVLMGPTALGEFLEEKAEVLGKRNVVLLLDDAAHAFLPEQQQLFFDFLTSIRRPRVTFKAAIYPGVTEFSRTFNVGHEARLVDAWLDPDAEYYLPSMRAIYQKRALNRESATTISQELVDLFALASFGIPRTFISMVEQFVQSAPTPARTVQVAIQVIQTHVNQTRRYHEQLGYKLPRLTNFVNLGSEVLSSMIEELRVFNLENRSNPSRGQAVDIAVRRPVDPKLRTIANLLEYAGLLRRTNESVSVGSGAYDKIAVNRGILLAENALTTGKRNPSISERADLAMKKNRQFSFKRVDGDRVLSQEMAARAVLQIGPCPECGAARPVENARFCLNCGAAIMPESRYEALIKTALDELELPFKKKEALHAQGFTSIEDILRDKGGLEIRKSHRVGEKWTRVIIARAEEYVSV